MKKLRVLLLAGILISATVGCGGNSEKDKGKNSGLDRPRPAGGEK
jgi:hypothetical protein